MPKQTPLQRPNHLHPPLLHRQLLRQHLRRLQLMHRRRRRRIPLRQIPPGPRVIHGHLVLLRPRVIQHRAVGSRLRVPAGAGSTRGAHLAVPASLPQPKEDEPRRGERCEGADHRAGNPRFGRRPGRRCAGSRGRGAGWPGGVGRVDTLAWVGARLRVLRGGVGGFGQGGGPNGDGGAVGRDGPGDGRGDDLAVEGVGGPPITPVAAYTKPADRAEADGRRREDGPGVALGGGCRSCCRAASVVLVGYFGGRERGLLM